MKKKRFSIFAVIFSVVFLSHCLSLFAEEYAYKYKNINDIEDAHKFQQLRTRLNGKIRPKEKGDINFAIGEYYFRNKVFYDSRYVFAQCISENPIGINTLLAHIYLYKLAKLQDMHSEAGDIAREVLKEQFVLLFNKYKMLKYTSLYGNEYEVRYFVDKIEVFLNGDLFEEIKP